MKIKQAFVTTKNPVEIFSIIEDTLSTRPNTQIFVEDALYRELRWNGWKYEKYRVSSPNYVKGFHYYHDSEGDGGERWLALFEGSNLLARGSFIGNCKEYMQLVEFHSSKVEEYIHYLNGFKQLLLIRFNPES